MATASPPQTARATPPRLPAGILRRLLEATELDVRMLGMVAALAAIWLGFHIASGGAYLTARNLWNLSVQTASVAVMATGMVLVIVIRHIDLSVGAILGVAGMIMGFVQVRLLPEWLGLGHPMIWILALAVGLAVAAAIGALQGAIIAYGGVPSFIVTLGGLLAWRGATWWITAGQTLAPMDPTFSLIGGGPEGAIGFWPTWLLALAACAAVIAALAAGRRQRQRFAFPLRPLWAEALLAALYCAVILGAAAIANAYPWPRGVVARWAKANGITLPEGGLEIAHGIAIPVLIALGVAVTMTFLARRTRFGRATYAIGGNPEAAALAGVAVRWVTVKVFALMGLLCGIAAAISTARLDAAANNQGELDELLTIAAAVIGGTSLAGGAGVIAGAVLGALVMQSLQTGMILMGVDTPMQRIVVGAVLVFAVWLDGLYRRRVK